MVSLRSMLARRIVRILDTSRRLSTRAGRPAVAAMLDPRARRHGAGRPARCRGTQARVLASFDKAGRGQVQTAGQDDSRAGGGSGRTARSGGDRDCVARPAGTVSDGVGESFYTRRPYELIRKTADPQGRFEIAFEPEINGFGAGRRGRQFHGPGEGARVRPGLRLKDSPIRLSEGDVPINGRLVDLEGRPVAGVKVRIVRLYFRRVPKPDARPMPGLDRTISPVARSLGLDGEPALPGGVVTDADGRFRIEGLGRDTLASLEISGQNTALKQVQVLARAMERIAGEPREPEFTGLAEPATYGANCTIAVEPSRPIEGVVRDAETRQPIPGAVVTLHQLSGSLITLDGTVLTQTDAQGRYRLIGLPKARSGGHKLAVYPPLDQPYFITRDLEFPAWPGLDPVTFDIALKRGGLITGKITDLKTGKPVQATVDYFPFLSNPHARDYPNFDPRITASVAIKTRYRTDREGRFQIPGSTWTRSRHGTYLTTARTG